MKKTILCWLVIGLVWRMGFSQQILPLWSKDSLPLAEVQTQEQQENRSTQAVDRKFREVHEPTITVYLPTEDVATGKAVLICPGGGYTGLAIDKEGHDVARWLATEGIAGVVLKYRLPHSKGYDYPAETPLKDARKAMNLIRQHATDWSIDPTKIGVMGFSAGGHLAAWLSSSAQKDDAARPAFQILVYPVINLSLMERGTNTALLGAKPSQEQLKAYSPHFQVDGDSPTAFLVHAANDRVLVQHSLDYFMALQAKGVLAELHVFPSGGHGFGIRKRGKAINGWPELCLRWMRLGEVGK